MIDENSSNYSSDLKNADQDEDIFAFETESLPLKGNKDYMRLLQCLNLLTGLRTQALKDIDKVLQVQDAALSDPLEFVRKLKKGEDIGLPNRLHIPEIPEIDWTKYKMPVCYDAFRPITRPKGREVEDHKCDVIKGSVVRGRVMDKDKPSTFNQLWTPEEQLRLEELLIKYPPEANEARRFKKIAAALGNRTLKQVTSRCQKYFAKLHQAGLPVPGRPPRQRSKELYRNPKSKYSPIVGAHQSSFFPRAFPPVALRDDGDLPGTASIDPCQIKIEPLDSEEGEMSDASRGASSSTESRKLVLLRRVRADLARHGDQPAIHQGFMCNVCREEPLRGTRWHCLQCGDVDMCSVCLIAQLDAPDDHPQQHPLDHALAAYRPAVTRAPGADKDYAPDPGQYHYLDPAFQPD